VDGDGAVQDGVDGSAVVSHDNIRRI